MKPSADSKQQAQLDAIETTVAAFAETIEDRWSDALDATSGVRMNRRCRIVPRWGCGSPATLRFAQVKSIALDEVRNQLHAACGIYGEEQQEQALADGALKGIALVFWETRCHWHYVDLLTGDVSLVPYTGRKRCKHTRISQAEYERRLREAHRSNDTEDLLALTRNHRQLIGKEEVTA